MWVDQLDPWWSDKAARVAELIPTSHRVVFRLDVYANNSEQPLVGADATYLDGEVKDEWVTGIRRSINISVPPTTQWRDWLAFGVELRPFRGVVVGNGEPVWYPLGRFPIKRSVRALQTAAISLSASDAWQRIVDNSLPYPQKSALGTAIQSVTDLITDALNFPRIAGLDIYTSNTSDTPSGVWDKTRNDTITELLKPLGVEAYIERNGRAIIRDRPIPSSPAVTLKTGVGGTLTSYSQEVDQSRVINAVSVISSAANTRLLPVVASVTNTDDPAHWIHTGGVRTLRYSSSAFKTTEQMQAAADSLLAKGRASARQWTFGAIPHPGLDASDTVLIQVPGEADEWAQIQTVTHPLTADKEQQITTVSTRPEDTPDG